MSLIEVGIYTPGRTIFMLSDIAHYGKFAIKNLLSAVNLELSMVELWPRHVWFWRFDHLNIRLNGICEV